MLNILSQDRSSAADVSPDDVLSTIRLSGALQFSIMVAGEWQADAVPFIKSLVRNTGAAMPFHIDAQDGPGLVPFPVDTSLSVTVVHPVNDTCHRNARAIAVQQD
ncbi:hypothetical protein [Rhizobium sp. SG570]|jgi:hypothetical protein|uniref:hypothetical protein n=1 Tax=Rhizobium sp. SG570 TaxID=2587113 RepID=UPI0014453F0A|nr:hypothetical protein [Rhizobium sp. SG570]NKJ40002.1 hypothetical protein [Rhizobium sp. SG570]NRP87737.1 hypothetical protein [Ensifer adhaerens]